MTNETELMLVSAVAEKIKTTPLNVMMHIKRGLLIGEEIDGTWYVPAASLADYLSKAEGAAHGSICKSHCKHSCSSNCA